MVLANVNKKIELFPTLLFYLLVAMYSNKLANFESDYDLVALGIQNVWICEVGSKEMHGSFENFTTFILNSSVSINFHIKLICKHIFSYFSFTFINPDHFFQI